MAVSTRLTVLEALGIAVKSEIEAAHAYQAMARCVLNRELKAKLGFLAGEEKKHRRLLTLMFRAQAPGVRLILPAKSMMPKLALALAKKASVPTLFRLAMAAEKHSEAFYRAQAARAEDASGKQTFEYLANMEQSHYFLLKSEHDLIVQNQAYYKVEKHEMVHFGP